MEFRSPCVIQGECFVEYFVILTFLNGNVSLYVTVRISSSLSYETLGLDDNDVSKYVFSILSATFFRYFL